MPGGLRTRIRWRPWLPERVPAEADPLAALYAPSALFTDEGTGVRTSALSVLRAVRGPLRQRELLQAGGALARAAAPSGAPPGRRRVGLRRVRGALGATSERIRRRPSRRRPSRGSPRDRRRLAHELGAGTAGGGGLRGAGGAQEPRPQRLLRARGLPPAPAPAEDAAGLLGGPPRLDGAALPLFPAERLERDRPPPLPGLDRGGVHGRSAVGDGPRAGAAERGPPRPLLSRERLRRAPLERRAATRPPTPATSPC